VRRRFVAAVLSCALAVITVAWNRADAQSGATVTILHINDIYEIDAIEGGRAGGLSRTATVLRRLERAGAPVVMTLGGDYLSPAAIASAIVDGEPLAGRQMVDVLNHVGLDFAVFGNHEFDVSESAFRARLAESRFRVVASNVSDANGQLFPGTVRSVIVPLKTANREVRLGLIGLTMPATVRPWVRYAPPMDAAREQLEQLKGKVDAVVALTHLTLEDDQELVTQLSGIDVVLGGHEHENWLLRRGPDFTPIIKADANVRSVAVVTLTFGRANMRPSVSTRLEIIDQRIEAAADVQEVVRKWMTLAFDAFRASGFDLQRTVAIIDTPLDGRESTVRNQAGRLTDVITAAFDREAGGVDVAILNGGSIRLDDVVRPGAVTEYEVLRILPFGGRVTRAVLDGALLQSILEIGVTNRGTGGYLHVRGAERKGTQWMIAGKPLNVSARYTVALTDFLLSGGETNLGFLTRTNPAVHDVQDLRDVRLALITELRRQYPAQ
jgi:5'-nucleotidase / UDP-sugar diphosphatase